MTLHRLLTIACASSALLSVLCVPAVADNRPFTFVYEATTTPKGMIEYEQTMTWQARRGSPGNVDLWEFRHEIEFGITDRFQLGLYLSNWEISRAAGNTDARWQSVSLEAICNLTNPTTDWLGSALYGEVTAGDRVVELEGKLILQKNLGRWLVAYNATIEAEWEGSGLRERTGVFEQSLGVSYEISPRWSVGAELLHEVEFEDWRKAGDHALYLGPNASHRFKRGFVTTTVLFQATGIRAEPDVQTRLIFGIEF